MSEQPTAPKDSATIRDLVGSIWIDSGQLVLTDPFYLEELDSETLDSLTDLGRRQALVNEGMAAVFRSGLRNTKCPVYVTRFANGALARIEVILDERFDNEAN